ncbi:PAS-domain containing protein [Marinomonas sp. 2405UD68-3]|uniref:hybrid sensor histidine kinase/response regulator n=1 Tax=Marinomonas sp. 2405UD68-3 TaxID=3391835 RepID=UPI0039C9A795
MFPNWQLALISMSYIGLLFVIAFLGDKFRHRLAHKSQPIIYALTLGVYCTSWSFLGTTGQASNNFLSHLPIYVGPILLFIFAWPFIQRIIHVSLKLNLTSIADLLASRFGKSHNLAILVTLVALAGALPYIALQLKGIVYSFQQLQADNSITLWQFGLIISLVLSGFTILFGVRHIDVTERHPGVMLAIAFESLIKLIAFLAVGIFVCFVLFDSPVDIWRQSGGITQLNQQLQLPNITAMFGMLIIVMAAFLSLPRQFQVMVVELKNEKDTWLSRRIFPLYLLVFALFAAPLGLAGHLLLEGQVPSDSYVLLLPLYEQQTWLTLLSFIGAISAASSMVIISSISLSTMLSNEIVFPVLFKISKTQHNDYDKFRLFLLNVRKVLVLLVILLSYGVFLMVSPETLSSMGEVAFGAFSQLTPALIAAFYWRRATLAGVYSGILFGFILWLILNFLPQLGLYHRPFMDIFIAPNTMATLLSLSANVFTLWLISQISRQSVQEQVQASLFIEWQPVQGLPSRGKRKININELQLLLSRFVGEEKSKASFNLFIASNDRSKLGHAIYNQALLQHTENTLASVMGASSARLVLSSALDGRDIALNELAVLVEEASNERAQFSNNLLHSSIENAGEGISIIDANLNLVAWNKMYLTLFNYPSELVYVGSPIEDLIRYNVTHSFFDSRNIEDQVNKRLRHLRKSTSHSSERQNANGQTIRIQGNPLPGGGFVMMFSDVTAYRQAEQVLKEANLDLEARVIERTQKLVHTNEQLVIAQRKAEQAHIKKSLYLKTYTHDLMQPLEAARLFTSALSNSSNLSDSQYRQVNNIDHALKVASKLISDLGEMARIESGNIQPSLSSFSLHSLFQELLHEFCELAKQKGVSFSVIPSQAWVYSDQFLLRRILQNLIANAFRYASPGNVYLNAVLKSKQVIIQVIDNGPGIPREKQKQVFQQFTQLDSASEGSSKGMGLGLFITQSLADLLNHPLHLQSELGEGCKFTLTLEGIKPYPTEDETIENTQFNMGFKGITVLCIDNDKNVLNGMVELLTMWECNVLSAFTPEAALDLAKQNSDDLNIILADYQLDNNMKGLQLICDVQTCLQQQLPAILITASDEHGLQEKCEELNVGFMRKSVKPAALRALMSSKLTQYLQNNYRNG